MYFTQFPCLPQHSFIVCVSVHECVRECLCLAGVRARRRCQSAAFTDSRISQVAAKRRWQILMSFRFINYNLLLSNSPHDWSAQLLFVITVNLLNFRRYESTNAVFSRSVVVWPHLPPCCLHSLSLLLFFCSYYCSLMLGDGNKELLGKFIVFCSTALARRDSARD